jgi:cytochrome c
MSQRAIRHITRAIGCLLLAGIPALLPAAENDAQRGAAAFNVCAACHSLEPGRHLTGPSLANVFGHKAGAAPGFMRYSDALQKSGIVWNERTFDAWLANPAKLVPGNDMTFPGIKEPQTRQDVIAYLKAVSEGKAPAPAAQGGMMGMMGEGSTPNLKQADADSIVRSMRHCGDTYFVTTADGKTHKVWEFNLRFKTDSSANGPSPGKPAVVGVGMRGDRVAIVFAAPSELSSFIKQSCQ